VENTGLTPAMEDYLEALLRLEKERGSVRVKELAKHLGLTNATVSTCIPKLNKLGLVESERYGPIRLTPLGREIAGRVLRREELLVAFFQEVLGLSEEMARREACLVEHSLKGETLLRLEAFLEFLRENSPVLKRWMESRRAKFSSQDRTAKDA